MGNRCKTEHSAYWYAKNRCWTHSDKATHTGRYIEMHEWLAKSGREPSAWLFDSFNPILLGVCIAMDIGEAVRRDVRKILDPAERDRMKRELMRDLRAVRRPFYYARETERRRELAAERRRITRRRTTAPMPTPEELLEAWGRRTESREAMIRLGGMLHDLECYVDNALRFDESGAVVGRNGGIRGWLRERVPELAPKYKTLMRYKAMAVRLRQATDTKDPTPTAALLEGARHEVVSEILSAPAPVFAQVFRALERRLSPDAVFLDAPNPALGTAKAAGRRRSKLNLGKNFGIDGNFGVSIVKLGKKFMNKITSKLNRRLS